MKYEYVSASDLSTARAVAPRARAHRARESMDGESGINSIAKSLIRIFEYEITNKCHFRKPTYSDQQNRKKHAVLRFLIWKLSIAMSTHTVACGK